jgi:hypothetical protein
MSSHRRLIVFLSSPLTLVLVRRFALIAVGAAVAYLLLLPAAVAWLRQPATIPLPGPVSLDRSGDSEQLDEYAVAGRGRSKLLSRSRTFDRTMRVQQRRRPATRRVRTLRLAPTPARVSSRAEAEDDHEVDDPVHALETHGDDEPGDD